MNERIRELAEQAGGYLSQSYEHDGKLILSGEDIVKKFAELIVKECMELAMTEKSRYANLYNKEADQNKYLTMLHCATSMDNYRLLLKEHFGVEE
jgi:roadblock/LC7 domain-containing protein